MESDHNDIIYQWELYYILYTCYFTKFSEVLWEGNYHLCFTDEERGSTLLRMCQGQTASRRQCQISSQENLTLQPLLLLIGSTTWQGVQHGEEWEYGERGRELCSAPSPRWSVAIEEGWADEDPIWLLTWTGSSKESDAGCQLSLGPWHLAHCVAQRMLAVSLEINQKISEWIK